jgi:hypothetical protein
MAEQVTARLNIKKFNMNEMQLNSKVAVIGKPGCFAAQTQMLMYDGTIKNIEDVMVHDKLIGDDGLIRNVLELRRGFENMYCITPLQGGEPVTVNETHIMLLVDTKKDCVVEITVKDYLKLPKTRQAELFWYFTSIQSFDGIQQQSGTNAKYKSYQERVAFIETLSDSDFECPSPDTLFILRSVGIQNPKQSRVPKQGYSLSTFTLEPKNEAPYYGFVLDSNHRFVLPDFSVVRNTGKSSLMKDLLYNHRNKFPVGLIMSETNKDSKDFDGMVPDLFTHDTYNQEALDNMVIRQKRMVRKNGEQDPRNFAFVILDDCMDDASWVHHPTIKGIFKNGRHWDLFFLLAMQYCLDIPPPLRTALDYIFILREPNLRNRKQLWENYASIFPTMNMFCDALDDLTQNYHCMVIKNRVLSNKIEDVVFWYKARIHQPFRIGTQEWWRWSEKHYNSKYEQEEEERRLAARAQGHGLDQRRGKNIVKLRVKMED